MFFSPKAHPHSEGATAKKFKKQKNKVSCFSVFPLLRLVMFWGFFLLKHLTKSPNIFCSIDLTAQKPNGNYLAQPFFSFSNEVKSRIGRNFISISSTRNKIMLFGHKTDCHCNILGNFFCWSINKQWTGELHHIINFYQPKYQLTVFFFVGFLMVYIKNCFYTPIKSPLFPRWKCFVSYQLPAA